MTAWVGTLTLGRYHNAQAGLQHGWSCQRHVLSDTCELQKQKLRAAEKRRAQQASRATAKAAATKAAEQQAIKDEAAAIAAAAFAPHPAAAATVPGVDPGSAPGDSQKAMSIKEQAAAIAAAAFGQAPTATELPDQASVSDTAVLTSLNLGCLLSISSLNARDCVDGAPDCSVHQDQSVSKVAATLGMSTADAGMRYKRMVALCCAAQC